MPQNYIKFYGNDWRSDPRLRLCSAASRGVWADMLTFMMEAEPFGHLLINGAAPTVDQIGMLTCTPPSQIRKAIGEMRAHGVFSETDNGVIYSRRMVRDKAREVQARVDGKRGGNPTLVNHTLNPPVNVTDKLAGAFQNPEAIIQKPKREARERGSRLPSDFVMPLEWLQEAAEKRRSVNLADTNLAAESAKFINHWQTKAGAGGLKLDWRKTWLNWAMSARADAGRGSQSFEPRPDVTKMIRDEPWEQRVSGYRRSGFWDAKWGFPPGERGCRAPNDLLSPDEIAAKEGRAA